MTPTFLLKKKKRGRFEMNGFIESNHPRIQLSKAIQVPSSHFSSCSVLKAEFSLVILGSLCFFNDVQLCIPSACLLSHFTCVRLFVIPWTVACQAPLSMGFSGKSTGVGCHFLLQTESIDSSKIYLAQMRKIQALST